MFLNIKATHQMLTAEILNQLFLKKIVGNFFAIRAVENLWRLLLELCYLFYLYTDKKLNIETEEKKRERKKKHYSENSILSLSQKRTNVSLNFIYLNKSYIVVQSTP